MMKTRLKKKRRSRIRVLIRSSTNDWTIVVISAVLLKGSYGMKSSERCKFLQLVSRLLLVVSEYYSVLVELLVYACGPVALL